MYLRDILRVSKPTQSACSIHYSMFIQVRIVDLPASHTHAQPVLNSCCEQDQPLRPSRQLILPVAPSRWLA